VPTTNPRWRKVDQWVGQAASEIVPVFLDHDDFAGNQSSQSPDTTVVEALPPRTREAEDAPATEPYATEASGAL
jgi:hypothetical protein